MSAGWVPERQCVACRKRRPKAQLLRFVLNSTGPHLEPLQGRGAYVCADNPTCWQEKKLKRTARDHARALSQLLASTCAPKEE